MFIWTLLVVAITFLLWKLSLKKFQYFKDSNIPHVPALPLLGSTWKTLINQLPYPEWMLEYTHKFRKYRFFGLSNFGTMTFMIQDPELIKQIAVKDFDNFLNHPSMTITEHDELLVNSLSVLRDQKWKDMRSILSPAFTGSKMRMMFDLIRECAEDFVSYCKENLNNDCIELNTKEIFSKVTMNVISTVAFGLKIDSLRDPENVVYKKATTAFDIQTLFGQIKLMILQMFPKLGNRLGFSMTKKDFNEFFKKMISDTVEHRRKKKTFRPDIIQLLIQAQCGTLKKEKEKNSHGVDKNESQKIFRDIDLAAQCFIFFFAGSDSTATLLNFAAYELAVNDDVQERLFHEIQETKKHLEGSTITYEALNQMQYLDAFMSEVLRVYPPGFITDRLCNRNTEIEDNNGQKITIPEGAHVWFNIYGLHHSHKYFPNPEKFNPDRFLGENRQNINSNAYLPFGAGPRNCIGSRFALMDVKMVIYSILSEFKFEVCDKSLVPIRYKAGFGLVPKYDLIFQLRQR